MTAGLLKVKRVHPDAQLPAYHSAGAACFDLAAVGIGGCSNDEFLVLQKFDLHEGMGEARIEPGESEVFGIGLAFEIPPGWVMLIFSRSSHAFQRDVRLANAVAVIDSDFRGEVKIKLKNDGAKQMRVRNGDRIAQAMLVRADQWNIQEVSELSQTERGEGGFGSTGT